MSLHLLLDENISPVVAVQVKRHRPSMPIDSVFTWQAGAFVGSPDMAFLQATNDSKVTLVTYYLQTIPSLIAEFQRVYFTTVASS
ncbi:MAG TPA: hypothetical protein VGK19_07465 [Capsulimonadaceae bacterium]|jgi:hypothetical protein